MLLRWLKVVMIIVGDDEIIYITYMYIIYGDEKEKVLMIYTRCARICVMGWLVSNFHFNLVSIGVGFYISLSFWFIISSFQILKFQPLKIFNTWSPITI